MITLEAWRAEAARRGRPVPPDATVGPADWRTYPALIYGVQHARDFVPWTAVPRAAQPRPLPVAPVDLNNLIVPDPEGGALSWAGFLDRTHADAAAVVHRGRLVFERYAAGMAPGTAHHSFSMSKSVVGILAELLIEAGRLDEHASASDHVPELRGSAFGVASVRSLLDMRDGVPFDEDYANPQAAIHTYSRAYWGVEADGRHGVLRALTALPATAAADAPFSYRTPAADVLGWVTRRAAGRSLAELTHELLWEPLGAEHDAYFLLDRAGDEIAGSGFGASLRDLARLAAMLSEGGRIGDRRVVPEAVLLRLLEGGCRTAFARSGQPTRPGWSYRSQWWVTHDDHQTVCALGVFGQRMMVSVRHQLALVRFGSNPVASNAGADALHVAAFEALLRRLG